MPRRTPQERTEQVNDWQRQAPYEHTISVLVPDVTHHDIAVRTMNVYRDLTADLVDLGSILRLRPSPLSLGSTSTTNTTSATRTAILRHDDKCGDNSTGESVNGALDNEWQSET